MDLIEYRVRPVTRYIVTRYHDLDDGRSGVETKGEFDNAETAHEVGYALCKDEHERLGYPTGDERIKYPQAIDAREPLGVFKTYTPEDTARMMRIVHGMTSCSCVQSPQPG